MVLGRTTIITPMAEQLYTRTGDDGFTGLLGEGRVAKYTSQPEAYGTVDEASAAIGVARAATKSPRMAEIMLITQRDLYKMMSELAATQPVQARFRSIDTARVNWVEAQTDAITREIVLPGEFIIPGDSLAGAYLDVARTTVRRAERVVVHLLHDGIIENVELVRYLNRLSSLLFVMGLFENALAGVSKVTLAKV
jgi:cob(I)alamin adenosyltransferase